MKKCQKCKSKANIWKTIVLTVLHGKLETYDIQCPICGYGTSYSYNTPEEAIAAWDKWYPVGYRDIDRKYAEKIK